VGLNINIYSDRDSFQLYIVQLSCQHCRSLSVEANVKSLLKRIYELLEARCGQRESFARYGYSGKRFRYGGGYFRKRQMNLAISMGDCKEIGGMYRNLTCRGAGGEMPLVVDAVFLALIGKVQAGGGEIEWLARLLLCLRRE